MNRTVIATLLAVSLFAALRPSLWAMGTCLAIGAEVSPWQVTRAIAVDADVWRWNWASWDQDKIVSAARL